MAVICVCKVVSDELVEPDVLAAQVLPVYTNISFTLGLESVSLYLLLPHLLLQGGYLACPLSRFLLLRLQLLFNLRATTQL